MGREVRRVPLDWEHPVDKNGNHIPLFDGSVSEKQSQWDRERIEWEMEPRERWSEYRREWYDEAPEAATYAAWDMDRPDPAHYRPDWDPATAVGYQFYETVTEGTPLSPVFSTPQELAHWLVVRGIFDTREAAERFVTAGWAPSFVGIPGRGLVPGTTWVGEGH